MSPKIAIYGGTFDPIHNAHLTIAETACDYLKLDRLIFMPAYLSPHKLGKNITAPEHRYNMVKIAIQNNPRFDLSRIELNRQGKSFTVDTLETIHRQYNLTAESLFLVIGGDSWAEFTTWRNPDKIAGLCRIVVAARPGSKLDPAPKSRWENVVILPTPLLNISSSDIREKLRQGQKVSDVPLAVLTYIHKNSLYTAP